MTTRYLACDLGAESGRLILGTLAGGKLSLEEIHRFPNTPVQTDGSLRWDIPKLFAELRVGLKKAGQRNIPIAGISTDSWGVDYLLFDGRGELIAPTFHYRDPRTARGVEKIRALVPWRKVFAETGIQFMGLNTLYQLAAESPERIARAEKLLLVGDGVNFLLSGVARSEISLVSTSQLYNPHTKTWSQPLLEAISVPAKMLPPIVPSGTWLGKLKPELARESGLPGLEVIATCSHDTGAAVAAVPATGENWAYLSSGTWSLMGVELPTPILSDACRELNFTNEIGYGGTTRLLKNIVGLWIVQECRREWERAGSEFDYATLTQLASDAPPFVSLINPADPRFLSPGDMPEKIAAFCRETSQPVPVNPGATIRCVLESLALLYRRTLRQIEKLTGKKITRLHIVGGGSRNELLNQFAANSLQLPMLAGPVEATAAGNILIQAITLGDLPSLAAARSVVKKSFDLVEIQPQDAAEWNKAFARLEKFF